jgi:hypothetical protein
MAPVTVQLPPAHAAGIRSSLAGSSQFTVHAAGQDSVDVEPAEGSGAVRKYFDVHRVATAHADLGDEKTWAFLAVRPPHSPKPDLNLPGDVAGRVGAIQGAAGLPANLRKLIKHVGVAVALTEVEDLPALFARTLPELFDRYPQGSLWYVSADPVLTHRLAFLRIALQLQLTPDAQFGGDRPGTYFGVHQLSGGGLNFAHVIKPVTMMFAPVVSGFVMNAPPHAFVFLFGRFDNEQDLRRHDNGPLAQAYFPSVNAHKYSPGIKVPMTDLAIAHVEAMLSWWATRLDVLYSHAADPSRFRTPTGEHDVAAQAAWLFTFERMLADCAALTAAVDTPGLLRMQGAFDALDKAAALLAADGRGAEAKMFTRLLRRSEAVPRLHQAMDRLPLQLRDRFRRWVTGVYDQLYSDIADGTMPGRVTKSGVLVGHDRPDDLRELTWDEYVPRLVREARNASHGLMSMLTEQTRPNTPAPRRLLLATNDGDIPASLYEVTRAIVFGLIAEAEALSARAW